jgi:hypothetical protein
LKTETNLKIEIMTTIQKLINEMKAVQNKVIAKIALTEREEKLFLFLTDFGLLNGAKKANKSGL